MARFFRRRRFRRGGFRKRKFVRRRRRFFRKKRSFRGRKKRYFSRRKMVFNNKRTRHAKWVDVFNKTSLLFYDKRRDYGNSEDGSKAVITDGMRRQIWLQDLPHPLYNAAPHTMDVNFPAALFFPATQLQYIHTGEMTEMMARLFRIHKTVASKIRLSLRMSPFSEDGVEKAKTVLIYMCVGPYNASNTQAAMGAPDAFLRLHFADSYDEVVAALSRINQSPNNFPIRYKIRSSKADVPVTIKLKQFVRFKSIDPRYNSEESDFIWSVSEKIDVGLMAAVSSQQNFPDLDPGTNTQEDLAISPPTKPIRCWFGIKDLGYLKAVKMAREPNAGVPGSDAVPSQLVANWGLQFAQVYADPPTNTIIENGTNLEGYTFNLNVKSYTKSWNRHSHLGWINRFKAPDYLMDAGQPANTSGTSASNWEGT